MELLKIDGLCKYYEKFRLEHISFSLEQGYIMGFIGRNGAGKTTTIKAMLNLIHNDGGRVLIAGHDMATEELACKQEIGVVLGAFDFYPKKKLKDIAAVTKRFYPNWQEKEYQSYLTRFELDESKQVEQLSAGMKVKFGLALALSHQARLLILDEPTSGLDPVSRDDLLELFRSLIEDGQRSILFSTHITSDLDKCADYITYIKQGRVLASADRESFLEGYRLVQGRREQLTPDMEQRLVGYRLNAFGFTGLAHVADLSAWPQLEAAAPDLETVMIYTEKGDIHESAAE